MSDIAKVQDEVLAGETARQSVVTILNSGVLSQEDIEEINTVTGLALADAELEDWVTDKPYVISVGNKKFNLKMKGRRQFEFIGRLATFLSEDLSGVFDEINTDKLNTREGLRLVATIVDPEILAGLGSVLLGEDKEFVIENFDIDWIIGGAEIIYNSSRQVRRLLSGFFGKRG